MPTDQIKTLLTNLGIDESQADELIAMDEEKVKTFVPDDYAKKVQTNFETKLKNNPEFWDGLDEKNINESLKKKIESSQYGRAANVVRKDVMKSFGLTEDDFKELGEEGKKLEVFLPHASKLIGNKSKVDAELQKQYIETKKLNEQYEAEKPELEKTYETKYQTKFNEQASDFVILAAVAKEQNLKVPAEYIYDKVAAKLKENYAIVVNGTTAELRQKSNPNLKALVENSSKELTLTDAVRNILKTDNLYAEEKKAGASQHTVIIEGGSNGFKQLSGHVSDKVARQIAEEAKQ